jgi:ABC-2 type transport system permease protein
MSWGRHMSRAWVVVKREFLESVRTKMFVLGTLFGPVVMAGFIVLPSYFSNVGGGGHINISIIDETTSGLGDDVATALAQYTQAAQQDKSQTSYTTRVIPSAPDRQEQVRQQLSKQIQAGTLDGYLLLPEGVLTGANAVYEGTNASAQRQMRELHDAVQNSVRRVRLDRAGIPQQKLAAALQPVKLEQRKFGGEEGDGGAAQLAIGLGYFMAFAIYMGVILYGASVARGVMAEKRDRIVEVILSSIRARDFMIGKVIGIGGAGVLQMGIWAVFAAIVLAWGHTIAAHFNVTIPPLPHIPPIVGFNFLFFFLGGFFLYAAMFASVGAIATSDAEIQQLQFPVMLPLIAGFFLVFAVIENPNTWLATVGTILPFTAPMVTPMRSAVVTIPFGEWLASVVLMIITVVFMVWIAAKIYRVGVLATGKRPSMKELMRWTKAT